MKYAVLAMAGLATVAVATPNPAKGESRLVPTVRAIFEKADIDSSGSIDESERARAGVPAKHFLLHDVDGDKLLTADEFITLYRQLLIASNKRVTPDLEAETARIEATRARSTAQDRHPKQVAAPVESSKAQARPQAGGVATTRRASDSRGPLGPANARKQVRSRAALSKTPRALQLKGALKDQLTAARETLKTLLKTEAVEMDAARDIYAALEDSVEVTSLRHSSKTESATDLAARATQHVQRRLKEGALAEGQARQLLAALDARAQAVMALQVEVRAAAEAQGAKTNPPAAAKQKADDAPTKG